MISTLEVTSPALLVYNFYLFKVERVNLLNPEVENEIYSIWNCLNS
jgi:hypothetical protein